MWKMNSLLHSMYLYMKKVGRICFVTVLLATVVILSSCGKYTALNVSVYDLAEKIVAVARLGNAEMTDLTQNGNPQMYGVAVEDVAEGVAYQSRDNIYFVAVVKAKDEDTLTHIELALRSEANELSRAWRYDKEKSTLADNRLLKSRGLYTILAVTENNAEAESVFDDMLSVE